MTNGAPRRGEVYFVNFDPVRGSEQAGTRPALIVSNNIANRHSSVVTVVAITSKPAKRSYPQDVYLPAGLLTEGRILCGQVLTVSKERLQRFMGPVDDEIMDQVDNALRVHLDL